jgi:transitional endoplasmic reticulum ATPase
MQILEMTAPAESPARAREICLSPAQRAAFEGVLLGLHRGNVVVLRDTASDGKTTVLNQVQGNAGGMRVGAGDFLNRLGLRTPAATEEVFAEMIKEALAKTDLLLVDDLNRIRNVCENCSNPRGGLFDLALAFVLDQAASSGTKLVFATDFSPLPLLHRAHTWVIDDLHAADYKAMWSAYLDPAAIRRMNFAEIHQFAPSLNAHQLRKAAEWLALEPSPDTACALDYLAAHNLESNVEIGEVEPVDLSDLKGVDDAIRELEAKVALPLADRGLAAKLNLKPKRGVLLAGPPGNGQDHHRARLGTPVERKVLFDRWDHDCRVARLLSKG